MNKLGNEDKKQRYPLFSWKWKDKTPKPQTPMSPGQQALGYEQFNILWSSSTTKKDLTYERWDSWATTEWYCTTQAMTAPYEGRGEKNFITSKQDIILSPKDGFQITLRGKKMLGSWWNSLFQKNKRKKETCIVFNAHRTVNPSIRKIFLAIN